jgi:hypothetical protein
MDKGRRWSLQWNVVTIHWFNDENQLFITHFLRGNLFQIFSEQPTSYSNCRLVGCGSGTFEQVCEILF